MAECLKEGLWLTFILFQVLLLNKMWISYAHLIELFQSLLLSFESFRIHFQESKWIRIRGHLAFWSLSIRQSPGFETLWYLRSHLCFPDINEIAGSALLSIFTLWYEALGIWCKISLFTRPKTLWMHLVQNIKSVKASGQSLWETHNQGTWSSWSIPGSRWRKSNPLETGGKRWSAETAQNGGHI